MKTNLVFTRTVTSEGMEKTEMKIVEVDIPEISSKDGWKLSTMIDKISVDKLNKK